MTEKSKKFLGTDTEQKGVDAKGKEVSLGNSEPGVRPEYEKAGPGQSGLPYRGSAEKKQYRTTGTKARKRVSPNSTEGRARQHASKL